MIFFDIDRETDCPICVCAAQERSGNKTTLRTFSGWGETRQVAREKCLLEAQERLAALWSDDIPTTVLPFADIPGAALNPKSITQLSSTQYMLRDQWNASVDPAHRHPRPFDPERPINWVQGNALADGTPVYMPAAIVYLGYPLALDDGFTEPDSNGLAAGADQQDALQRALLEVVERDAVSIWWYNKLQRPSIDLNSTKLSQAMSDWLRAQGRALALLDLTHDFDVPVLAAVSFDEMGSDISIGFAAGLSVTAAVDGALGELMQFDLTKRMSRTHDDERHTSPFLSGLSQHSRDTAPFLFPSEEKRHKHQDAVCRDDLIARFKQFAPETAVYVFPKADVSVMRVVAPGLRAIWPRFAAGRLYYVPVRMGWRRTVQQEAFLNTLPILY